MASTDKLVDEAYDASKHTELAAAVEQLSPEEALFFLEKLERSLLKRKVQLVGYLVAMVLAVVGFVAAIMIYGNAAPGTFMGWIFLLPFALVGLTLLIFGRHAERLGNGTAKLSSGSATEEARRGRTTSSKAEA